MKTLEVPMNCPRKFLGNHLKNSYLISVRFSDAFMELETIFPGLGASRGLSKIRTNSSGKSFSYASKQVLPNQLLTMFGELWGLLFRSRASQKGKAIACRRPLQVSLIQ